MSNTSLEQWKRIRSRGKQHFIWTHGLLLWTLITGSVVYGLLAEMQVFSVEQIMFYALLGAVGVAFTGYWYGCRIWKENEQAYKQITANSSGDLEMVSKKLEYATSKKSDNGQSPERIKSSPKTLNDYIKEYEQLTFAQITRNDSRR